MIRCLRHMLIFLAFCLLAIPVPVSAQGAKQPGLRLKTVVIDAGHGGKDAGCVSRDGKTYEKTITLDIARRLCKKIESAYQDVNVIMTRNDDRFVELENRAVIANKANANLFISIHVNSVEKGTTANGYSIHVLGQSQRKGNDLYSKNLDLVKRENSVIMLEDNYQTRYQGFDPNDPQSSIIFSLMQNASLNASLAFAEDVADAMSRGPVVTSRGVSQDPFWVLWRTTMPSVLVEVGFMSNQADLAILRSENGRDAIANNIFNAFWAFKTRYDKSLDADDIRGAKKETTAPSVTTVSQEEEIPVLKEEKAETVAIEEKPKAVVEEKPKTVVEEKPVEEPVVKEQKADIPVPSVYYGIQVAATGKKKSLNDPFFKGYKPVELSIGSLYKYIVCTDPSLEVVRKSMPAVRSAFTDCFIVKVENGATTIIR